FQRPPDAAVESDADLWNRVGEKERVLEKFWVAREVACRSLLALVVAAAFVIGERRALVFRQRLILLEPPVLTTGIPFGEGRGQALDDPQGSLALIVVAGD